MTNLVKHIIRLVIATSFVLSSITLNAQQAPLFTHTFNNPLLINPGFVGSDSVVKAFGLYRNQWAGVPGTPVTQVLSVDGPLGDTKMGFGGFAYNDVSNIVGRTAGYLTYSYGLEIGEDHFIRLGLSLGAVQTRLQWDKINVVDESEETLLTAAQARTVPDGAFGIKYDFKDLEIGLSSTQLFQASSNFSDEANAKETSFKLLRHYYFTGAYGVQVHQNIYLKPMIVIRGTQSLPLQWDVNVMANYKSFARLGVGYRHNYGVVFQAGVTLNENIDLGYSYDLGTSQVGPFSRGSHEIMVAYTFRNKPRKSKEADSLKHVQEVDHEQLMYVLERIDGVKDEVDSLDQRIANMKKEIDFHQVEIDSLKLKKQQLAEQVAANSTKMDEKLIEIRKIKEQLAASRDDIHRFVDTEHIELSEVDTFDLDRWDYYVVVGTYPSQNYAKFLQRVLLRDYKLKTTATLSDNKEYYLVWTKQVYDPDSALEEVRYLNRMIDKEYLDEGAWVYHKKK